MSYEAVDQMTKSLSLHGRVAACAAVEGYPGDPTGWVTTNMWQIVTRDDGWQQAWDYATASPSPNYNPDTGIRDDVVSDQMILSVVQPMLAEEAS
jgi:hypothetical protein